jgi:hypothetical protein
LGQRIPRRSDETLVPGLFPDGQRLTETVAGLGGLALLRVTATPVMQQELHFCSDPGLGGQVQATLEQHLGQLPVAQVLMGRPQLQQRFGLAAPAAELARQAQRFVQVSDCRGFRRSGMRLDARRRWASIEAR